MEPPIAVHAGLPDILRLVVLLGAERGLTEILLQELHLFEECLGYLGGSVSSASRALSLYSTLIESVWIF